MYTQCPDCSTAFRVTADVLKQAAGKVRCGGCGNAFNALAYLSESMPEQSAPKEANEALPELTPEPTQKGEGLPTSISAEQSAALLKTLDELAGSDIRIEDTGVEWRVLDDDEVGEAADDLVADEAAANDISDESFETSVDEFLEESPTPVDQFLTETPARIDSPEIFEDVDDEPARTSVDELRFDDNTPLPDDFDLDNESLFAPAQIDEPEEAPDEPDDLEDDEPQADFDLSEPDEWTDILGEFEDLVEAVAEPVEDEIEADIEAELATIEATDEPAPATAEDSGNQPLDMDSQFALQAEAMGIDLSGMHETLEDPVIEDNVDLELLLEDADVEVQDIEDLLDEDLVDEVTDNEEDTQLDFIEVESDDSDDEFEEDEIDELEEDELLVDELEEDEPEVDELEVDEPEVDELEEDEPEVDEPEEVEPEEDEPEVDELEVDELEVDELEEDEPELDAPEVDELEEDEPEEDEPEVDEPELDTLEEEGPEVDEPEIDPSEDDYDEFELPPLTEEEQTINMQIDQDLLALAIEDEDGFASTIVIPEELTEEKALKDKKKDKKKKKKDKERALKDTSAGFETIIMEGEAFRSSDDADSYAAAAAASLAVADAEREAAKTANAGGRRWGMIGGAIALVLFLTVQVLHQSREALATNPTFNSIAGPLYRSIGMPLSPEWDITGWRFEATKGSTDENDENLTVYSRLGNKSDKPLPYPIVAISLTDRFEETVGSRILDPSEYLSNDLDPRKLVEPGNTFNAAITIQSPAEEATGFKLNVCYRESGGDLRCAIDDFK